MAHSMPNEELEQKSDDEATGTSAEESEGEPLDAFAARFEQAMGQGSGRYRRVSVSREELERRTQRYRFSDAIEGDIADKADTHSALGLIKLYEVELGDTLDELASRFGVTLEVLLALNPQLDDPDLLYPGQLLILPS